MRKHRRILLLAGLVVLGSAVAWLVFNSGPPDPVYAGRKLSSWLAIYYPDNQYRPETSQADAAVRKLGTNALPLLLHLLQANDPPWKIKLYALLDKQHLIKLKHTPPLYFNYAASAGFRVLGPSASNAVPALIDLYGRNISRDSQIYITFSFGGIGPSAKAAIPLLMRGSTNTQSDPLVRLVSIQALGEIHSEPERVVPLLIQILGSSSSSEHEYAADALAEFGTNAAPAAPALLKLLHGGDNPSVMEKATTTLKAIDPAAAAKAGFK